MTDDTKANKAIVDDRFRFLCETRDECLVIIVKQTVVEIDATVSAATLSPRCLVIHDAP